MTMAVAERLLIPQGEACLRLGVSRPTLIAEIDAGRLRYVLVGKRRKFKLGDLEAYIERQGRGCAGNEASSRGGQGRRTGTKTSRSMVIDFEAALRLTTKPRPKSSPQRSDRTHLGKLTGKKPELTLSQALGRYLMEHGQHLSSAGDIKRMGVALIADLGKHKLLSEITPANPATYAARRRATLSNRSVNVEIEHLRAVIRRAGRLWGIETPEIAWQSVLLEESGEREHVLSEEEEERLFAALRPDYRALVGFALITGLRLGNVVGLTWRQVDWDARRIVFRVKSKKPGGELHYVPITPALAAILSIERGRHVERVFTYVCNRKRHDRRRGMMQEKGRRYPFTHDGWRKAWGAALEAATIKDFRFHDLRHTAGTRALHAHRNLKTVQRMLGHKNIATTLRYTRSDVEDVRAAMEAVETQSRRKTIRSDKKGNA